MMFLYSNINILFYSILSIVSIICCVFIALSSVAMMFIKNTSGLGYFHSTGRYFTNMKDLRDYIKAQADSKPDFICFKLEKSKFLTDDVLKGILDKVDEAVAGVLCTGGQYYTIHNKRQLVFFYGIEYSHRFT